MSSSGHGGSTPATGPAHQPQAKTVRTTTPMASASFDADGWRRPQTSDELPNAGSIFRPTVVRPASHIGTRSAKERERATPPAWAVVEADGASLPTAHQLKEEYEAMKNQEVATQLFEQKLNIQHPPINVQHMAKDWRWYQHIGSKGNLWNDMHMTPEERRHLVVTPTVARGYKQQERTLEKKMQEEEDRKKAQMERTQLMRQQRRFFAQDQNLRTQQLQILSRQSRPGTSMNTSRPATGASGRGTSRAGTNASGWRVQTAGAGSVMTAGTGSLRATTAGGGGGGGLKEVARPASELGGATFSKFDFTTMLSGVGACVQIWELERPDRQQVAAKQAYNKEQLEVAFMKAREAELQRLRQNRIRTLQRRSKSRQDLELRSGQAAVRAREQQQQQAALGGGYGGYGGGGEVWRPSGYGTSFHPHPADFPEHAN